MLRAHEVTVRAGAATLLERVSVNVRAGEVLCAVGPNGAGKSTLLGALCGTVACSDGAVSLDGRRLASWGPRALARRRAVLVQTGVLTFPLTTLQVVALGRMPWAGLSDRARDRACVEAALAATATAHLAERRYPTLSGGERQRVQLARALTQIGYLPGHHDLDGRHLLLDEPTSALDLAHQHACLRLAREVASRGGAVFAVVHDPNLALQYADRVIVVDRATVVDDGPPERVITAPRVLEVFGVEAVIRHHAARERAFMVPL